MAEADRQSIVNSLWPLNLPAEYKVWAILDGARDERIYSAVIHLAREKYCLYRGKLAPELVIVAPYLVRLEPSDAFFDYFFQFGWGNSWGIFLRSRATCGELCRHLRRFLMVEDETGRQLVFRYYDPRVLRIYLPTCQTTELRLFFGCIQRFFAEEEDRKNMREYVLDGTVLREACSS